MNFKNSLKSTVLAASVLCASTAFAQDKSNLGRSKLGIDFNLCNDVSYGTSSIKQTISTNWEQGYVPSGGSMTLKNFDGGLSLDSGIEIEPYFKSSNNWRIGVPINYKLSILNFNYKNLSIDKPIGANNVEWWDSVALTRLRVKKTTPAIGISVQKGFMKLEATVQEYQLLQETYKGINNVNAINEAASVNKTTLEKGLSKRVSLFYHNIDAPGSVGIFYEEVGKNASIGGITFKCKLNTTKRHYYL